MSDVKKGSKTTSDDMSASTTTFKPKLIVFDLDYTLWPFWCDTHVRPPFTKKGVLVFDSTKYLISPYDESLKVLENLQNQGYSMAVASRTGSIDIANRLTNLFGWDGFFEHKQIYPGSKVTHFQKLKKETSLDFQEMLFFDDETRNIEEVGKLGVCCILVNDGIDLQLVNYGLKRFQETYQTRLN